MRTFCGIRCHFFFLVFALAFSLFGLGCSDDVTNQTILSEFFAGDFPSVKSGWKEHNGHTKDGQAFSHGGQTVEKVRYFANSSDVGKGILLYTTQSDSVLWASYQNSGNFTPPVEIFGENQADSAKVNMDEISIIWLDGSVNSSRNGDALMLYSRQSVGDLVDSDNDGTHENTGNKRLYSTYFDVSQSGNALGKADDGKTLQYGFSSQATFVDSDPNSSDDNSDPDVGSYGFVSDGLVYSAQYNKSATSKINSGDSVNFLYAIWTQEVNTDSSNPVGRRVWYSKFDLSSTSTTFPAPSSLSAGSNTVSASSSLATTDAVDTQLLAHNGLLIWKYNDASDSNEEVLQATVFSNSGLSSTQLLSRRDNDASDTVAIGNTKAENLYGNDHGLSTYWFFFEEQGFDDGSNFSSARDVMAVQIELDGSGANGGTNDSEIDAFNDNGSADGTSETIQLDSMKTRMPRCGDLIVVYWLQGHSNDNDPTTNTTATTSAWVNGIVPSVTTGIPDADTGPTRLNSDVRDQSGETSREVLTNGTPSLQAQQSLADGTSSPARVIQSDRFKVHFTWVQDEKDNTTSDDEDTDRIELHTAFVEFEQTTSNGKEVAATPPSFTSASGTSSDTLVDSVDETWDDSANPAPGTQLVPDNTYLFENVAVDGDGGEIFIFYLNNGNNKDDDSDSGSDNVSNEFKESRLFMWTSSFQAEISSDGSSGSNSTSPDYYQAIGFHAVQGPINDDCINAPNYDGRFVHLLISEAHSSAPPIGLAHRVLDKDSTASSLEDKFTPVLSLNGNNKSQNRPQRIDRGITETFQGSLNLGDATSGTEGTAPSFHFVQQDGSEVAVYMQLEGNIFYNQWNPSSGWQGSSSQPAPSWVDHDSSLEAEKKFFLFDSSNVRNAPVFDLSVLGWLKFDTDTQKGSKRLGLRVHR